MFEFNHKYDAIVGKHLTLELIEAVNQTADNLPYCRYKIKLNGETYVDIGELVFKFGDNLKTTYEGNLFVEISKDYKGKKYGYQATRMIFKMLRSYGLDKFYACCSDENMSGRNMIDLLGGQLLEIVEAPTDIEMDNKEIENYAIFSVEIPPVDFENSLREEHCSMSLVFCNDKVLTLTNDDGKLVLPKGHIEENETSMQAAMRECFEESGCMLIKEDYIKEVSPIDYTISYGTYKNLTPLQFYGKFGVCKIHKTVDVHVFKVDEELPIKITEHENFLGGKWMKVDEFLMQNVYDDQLQAIVNGLNVL